MSTRDVVLGAIQDVAERLGPELAQVAFVGGTVAALYAERELDIRPTNDVDLITNATLPEYYALLERLKKSGFKECLDKDAPVCRLICEPGLRVDVMPVDARVLGFSNPWYAEALAHAETFQLPNGLQVRALAPVYFVATKLEAFKGRGHGDFAASHDLEDVISLLGRMPEVLDLIEAGTSPVASSVCADLRVFSKAEAFIDAVPGFFLGSEQAQELATLITHRLLRLAQA